MTLQDWKLKNRYTIDQLSELSGIKSSKVKRILAEGHCVRLDDADAIVTMTRGEVTHEDLTKKGEAA